MIVVLNRDVVLMEAVELARLKIAQALSCDPRLIDARIDLKDGKPAPTFGVPQEVVTDLPEADVREVLSSVYWGVRRELSERMEFLGTTRQK